MAKHITGRTRIVVTEATSPQVRQVMKTYAPGFGLEIVAVLFRWRHRSSAGRRRRCGGCRSRALPAAELLRLSSSRLRIFAAAAVDAGALVAHVDPISLGRAEAPGRYGCAIVAGEGAGRRERRVLRGPHYGFSPAARSIARRMPGRIVGETTLDVKGRRGYVLTPRHGAAHPP